MFLFFNDPSYRARFERHQANQRAIGGVAGVLYILQLFHAGFFRLDPVDRGFERMSATKSAGWFVDSTVTPEGERRASAGVYFRF